MKNINPSISEWQSRFPSIEPSHQPRSIWGIPRDIIGYHEAGGRKETGRIKNSIGVTSKTKEVARSVAPRHSCKLAKQAGCGSEHVRMRPCRATLRRPTHAWSQAHTCAGCPSLASPLDSWRAGFCIARRPRHLRWWTSRGQSPGRSWFLLLAPPSLSLSQHNFTCQTMLRDPISAPTFTNTTSAYQATPPPRMQTAPTISPA